MFLLHFVSSFLTEVGRSWHIFPGDAEYLTTHLAVGVSSQALHVLGGLHFPTQPSWDPQRDSHSAWRADSPNLHTCSLVLASDAAKENELCITQQ